MADVYFTFWQPSWFPTMGRQHGISIQSSINLGEILTKIVARLFIYQSPVTSLILDIILERKDGLARLD